jgi:hypothetical protein
MVGHSVAADPLSPPPLSERPAVSSSQITLTWTDVNTSETATRSSEASARRAASCRSARRKERDELPGLRARERRRTTTGPAMEPNLLVLLQRRQRPHQPRSRPPRQPDGPRRLLQPDQPDLALHLLQRDRLQDRAGHLVVRPLDPDRHPRRRRHLLRQHRPQRLHGLLPPGPRLQRRRQLQLLQTPPRTRPPVPHRAAVHTFGLGTSAVWPRAIRRWPTPWRWTAAATSW